MDTVYEITTGQGLSAMFGNWKIATAEEIAAIIKQAAELKKLTVDEIHEALNSGKSVSYAEALNYYYSHEMLKIRIKPIPQPVQMVKCSCGHTIPKSSVMSASLGTSCPDCYDRMSD